MTHPPRFDEAARLAELRRYDVLDTAPEPRFDRITRLASRLLDAPIALVSFVDESRQWFKSRVGLEVEQTSRAHAFCDHAIREPAVLVVPDARQDPRFADNPLVRGEPGIRLYAGAPLTTPGAHRIGTLCVIDQRPRELSERDVETLRDLAEVVVDELELRRVVAANERQLRLLRLAEEVGNIGHWRIDVKARELYWSPQTYRIHGFDPSGPMPSIEEAIARYHRDDEAPVRRAVQRAIERRTSFAFPHRIQREGEVRRVVSRGLCELHPETGEVEALFGVSQDITEQEALKSRLVEAEKLAAIGTLAAGVGHEINNPLTYIRSNVDLLDEELEDMVGGRPTARVRELRELTEEIRRGTRRIHRIVQSLKTFSRGGARRDEVLELRRLLEAAVDLCISELRPRAALRWELSPTTPPVRADASQLLQVVVNLLLRVAQVLPRTASGPPAAELRLVTGGTPSHAFFEVVTTGAAADRSERPSPAPPSGEGAMHGASVAVSVSLVAGLGGSLRTTTSTTGVPSFRVELPAASRERRDATPRAASAEAAEERRRVLVVDDEPLVGRAIARVLRPHEVEVTEDARAALERLADDDRYDAIVCDLMMPGMTGEEFHRAVAARSPALLERLLFVTGGAYTPEGRDFVERVEAPVLEKPVEAETLRRALRRLWNGAGPAAGAGTDRPGLSAGDAPASDHVVDLESDPS